MSDLLMRLREAEAALARVRALALAFEEGTRPPYETYIHRDAFARAIRAALDGEETAA